MLDQDLPKFALLITGIGEVYDKTFTSAVIEIYWSVLKSFMFEDVKKAVYSHLENPDVGKYLPKPADIIVAIEGSSQNQALRAWTKVVAAVHRVGRYTSVAFDDALILVIIEDMGGWLRLCNVKEEQLPFIKKEFQDRYRGYVVKKPTRYPKYLTGVIESQNSIQGYKYDLPILIGDKEKAKKVIEAGKYESIWESATLLPESVIRADTS